MSNIVEIGQNNQGKITAFGDDCKYNNINTYAYVFFENEKIDLAENILLLIKERYNIPKQTPLHMRILMNEKARKANKIDHLTRDKIEDLINVLYKEMNTVPFMIKCSYYSGKLPKDEIVIENNDDCSVRWSDKGMQSLLAKRALIPLNLKKYTYEDLKIVVSHDTTKIHFLGKGRRQSARWIQGFSTIECTQGKVFKFVPIISNANNEPLLQMADTVAYTIAHAYDQRSINKFYRQLVMTVNNIDIRPLVSGIIRE